MHELVLLLPQPLVEPVSDALVDDLQALSVSVADADAGTQAEQALFGEPGLPAPREGWLRSELTALFDLGYHMKHVDTIFDRVFGAA